METILLVIHLFLAIGLVVVVLMQRSEGGALGIGGGGGGGGAGGGMFSARGTANALTRATAILAVCFMTTSLMLAIISGHSRTGSSILDSAPAASQSQDQAPASTDSQPLVPLSD
ncbi:preprotein translocase subunit SecG [Hwanghaeella grinnelliae]|uniref:Protein-export membrane protein SecG n=1 Tax=Hwanghaeella grinnelliae TaxID=2500179 RepID=A0A3S2VQM4_9PROT|nr:preprotein translocase subunit SecG [Hwanghaeella grinnelliae]RVU39345.1 preprotein translocase subunit SecG [Hwanghaeella grinnelliae]